MITLRLANRERSKTSSKKKTACDVEVSILENSVYYFLSHVYMKKSQPIIETKKSVVSWSIN